MLYTYQDFQKSDKKILREIIEVVVKRDIKRFLNETFPVYEKILDEEHEDIRKPYWKLEGKFRNFSKHLQREYDNFRHSDLPLLTINWWLEGLLTDEDIATFSENGQAKLQELKERLLELRKH
ncbi:MAG: hypothetical protein AAFO82_00380 [Bacteroidota bacterium]